MEKELPPRIGTFGQTGTLRNLLHRSWPTPLKLFHGRQRGLAILGDLGRDLLVELIFAHSKLYGLTRTRQRFRRLEVGNGLIRNLTAPTILYVAGKTGIAINLVHLRVSF